MDLDMHASPEAEINPGIAPDHWTLKIPAGSQGNYRLAQLDNYTPKPRQDFPHHLPLEMHLRARVSSPEVPGTWGFGLWNDPFSLSLGLGGGTRRFPSLPNAVWFFFASPQNYLSFQDNLPAKGFIAQTFKASNIPVPLLALATPAFPLLLWPRLAQNLRPIFRHLIAEDSFAWEVNVTHWHEYTLIWKKDKVDFKVDHQTFETTISPQAPLGLVIWIDNQYAAFPPNGKLTYGTLENTQPAWLEIEDLALIKG